MDRALRALSHTLGPAAFPVWSSPEDVLVEPAFEYRVQCIGTQVQCFKHERGDMFKSNLGLEDLEQLGAVGFEPLEVEAKHIAWCDACRPLWGGLSFFALDVVRQQNGRDAILELNPTVNAFMYGSEDVAYARLRDLIISKLQQA